MTSPQANEVAVPVDGEIVELEGQVLLLEDAVLQGGIETADLNRLIIVTRRRARAKVAELKALAKQKAEAKKKAKGAFARAYLNSSGSIEYRKQVATLAAEEEQFKFDVADELVSACKEALKVLHDDFEAARSIGTNVRDELKLGGMQP